MRMRRAARMVLHLISTIAIVAVAVTLAFFLTASFYAHAGWTPPAVVVQIVNTALGMGLIITTVLISGLWFHRQRRGPFAEIIDALQRIAKGDFSTRLDDTHQSRGAVGELVQTVNDMALRLDQMEKMRQEFISDVSHEIQSPLTSIRGFAAALKQNDLGDEERRHYLDIIEAESTRLSKLSANLLKLASLESDQTKFEPKLYRLDTQIRNLILASETQWTGKQLEMEVVLEEASITADEDLLSQVWINLIHNSIKYTPKGGSVRVTLHSRGDRIEVSIADNGIGIPSEDQPRIFERFYKADKSRRPSEGGSGLGLAIAKKAVELHRGTIAVRSRLGAGAVFTVELPVRLT